MNTASVTVLSRFVLADRVLARLAVETALDPALAARYAADPRSVLAERGVELGADELAPALAPDAPLTVRSGLVDARAAYSHVCFVDAHLPTAA